MIEKFDKQLRMARIFYMGFLIADLVYIYILWRIIERPAIPSNNNLLNLMVVALAILSVVDMACGYLIPQVIIKGSKSNTPLSNKGGLLLTLFVVRSTMFETVAIYGLVLGTLGLRLLPALPFFGFSIALLLITFPTQDKWDETVQAIQSTMEISLK